MNQGRKSPIVLFLTCSLLSGRSQRKGFRGIRHGDSTHKIIDYALRRQIDLITMSTYGWRGQPTVERTCHQ